MHSQSILVTGGAGFIGSNFIEYFIRKNPTARILNVDKLTYAGSLLNTAAFEEYENYFFYQLDICDSVAMDRLFETQMIDAVIHLAAESHVDNSISGPLPFIKTNIEGTFTLLESARKAWMKAPHQPKEDFQSHRFHHISTDEVYGTLGAEGFFREDTAYAPNSPYSASKASSDFLVRAYHHTYGMNVTTSNCSNNYGPKQHPEKLIPVIIRRALEEKPIPIYGDGKNVRDWLYVEDHCSGIDLVFRNGISGQTYNIGGNNEKTNIQIAQTICDILDQKKKRERGSYRDLITFVDDRPGHDKRYAIDSTKIRKQLGWNPTYTFNQAIEKTIDWYLTT